MIFAIRKIHSFKYLFGVVDFLVIFISFTISAYILRKESDLGFLSFVINNPLITLLLLVISFVFIIVFQYNFLYTINIIITRAAHLAHIIKALYYGALNIVLIFTFN